jgi:hypothetical protein
VLQQNLWVTDGTVNAIAQSNSVIYIGGSFTQVGPPIGAAAAIDPASGAVLQPWPRVVGTVNVVVSDGQGGWYLGGAFTHVQDQPRLSLAHLDGNGNLTAWNPTPGWAAPVPIVNALVVSGGTVYVGGDFYTMNGLMRNYIAAVDASSGATTSWDPEPDDVVRAMGLSGNTLYVAGSYSGIGGQPRQGLAALDATTGLATSWNPGYGYGVTAMAVSSLQDFPFTVTVWIGGDFATIGGQARNCIASLDGGTAALTSWNPNANGSVRSLALRLTRRGPLLQVGSVYAGGDFTAIGGQARSHIAEIDGTGAATGWNPGANGAVSALAIAGPVIAGGGFSSIGGQSVSYLAALDAVSGAATGWNPNPNHPVGAVAYNGTAIFAGGSLTSLGGVPRTNIAALSSADGTPTGWSPYVSGPVYALAANGPTVYAGGDFLNVGGVLHAHVAAIDSSTGMPTTWSPTTDSAVYALGTYGNTMYVGGGFTNVSGQTRFGLGAIDLTTGAATAWNPGTASFACETCQGIVYALAVSALQDFPFTVTVWVGGDIEWIGYYPNQTFRSYLAAIDGNSGAPTSWNPNANGSVRSLALRLTRRGPLLQVGSVYAGGYFTAIGGQARSHIAEIDGTGAASNWNPNADGVVDAISLGSAVYAGGTFANIGGEPRNALAALDPTSGAATSWNAGLEGLEGTSFEVNAISVVQGLVYPGGSFIGVLGSSQASIGALSEALGPPPAVPAIPRLEVLLLGAALAVLGVLLARRHAGQRG